MLAALARTTGSQVVDFGICSDQIDTLRKQIQLALEYDALILSGGVSVGVLDLIPRVCAQLGLQQVFHKVCLKPGKPVWFGVDEQRSTSAPGVWFARKSPRLSGMLRTVCAPGTDQDGGTRY